MLFRSAAHKARTGAEQGFRYPGTCRELPDDPARKHVVRLKVPQGGSTHWDDLIKGRIEMQNETLQDAVLMRGDGIPLYNLGAAVDDISMGITLVAPPCGTFKRTTCLRPGSSGSSRHVPG